MYKEENNIRKPSDCVISKCAVLTLCNWPKLLVFIPLITVPQMLHFIRQYRITQLDIQTQAFAVGNCKWTRICNTHMILPLSYMIPLNRLKLFYTCLLLTYYLKLQHTWETFGLLIPHWQVGFGIESNSEDFVSLWRPCLRYLPWSVYTPGLECDDSHP